MVRFLALILPLLLTACGGKSGPTAHPAVWRATNGSATIWLLGTIHILPPDLDWQSGAVKQAIQASDRLILEIPPNADPDAANATFLRYAKQPGLPPVSARVPESLRPALDAAIARTHADRTQLDAMESWADAIQLAGDTGRAAGATADAAPEAVLAKAFAGRHIAALENLDRQLAMFDRLPEDAQRVLLVEALQDQDDFRNMLAGWSRGDTQAIQADFNRSFKAAPVLEHVLVTRRNLAWANKLATLHGTMLVAVGAGHMVGNQGLPALLNARGFRVARIQ